MRLSNNILAVLTAAMLACTGCNPAAKFSVAEVSEPVLSGNIEGVSGRVVVVNGSSRDLTIENALVTLHYRDRELGRARLLLPVAVAADGRTDVRYDLAVEGLSAGEVRPLTMRMISNPGAVTFDVEAWVRWGAWRKKIVLNRVPATRIIGIFAP